MKQKSLGLSSFPASEVKLDVFATLRGRFLFFLVKVYLSLQPFLVKKEDFRAASPVLTSLSLPYKNEEIFLSAEAFPFSPSTQETTSPLPFSRRS